MQGAWDHQWQIFRTQKESVVRYSRSVVPTSYLEIQHSKCFSNGRDDDRGERVGGCIKSVGVEWSKGASYCSACQTQSAASRDQLRVTQTVGKEQIKSAGNFGSSGP